MIPAVDSAKQFLLNKVIEQASHDHAVLSHIEKRMFLFSEMASAPDWQANETFGAEYDCEEYERKIAKFLRRAYAHDKKTPSGTNAWRECLESLKNEDFYGLVMVDLAKIPRPLSYWSWLTPKFIAFTIGELIVLALAFAALSDRFSWIPINSGWLRLFLFVLFVTLAWLLGEVYRRHRSLSDGKTRGTTVRDPQ